MCGSGFVFGKLIRIQKAPAYGSGSITLKESHMYWCMKTCFCFISVLCKVYHKVPLPLALGILRILFYFK